MSARGGGAAGSPNHEQTAMEREARTAVDRSIMERRGL
jgi:hypothetical protein